MKHLKLFVALFAMLALGVGNAWGATYSLTPDNAGTGLSNTAYITSLTEFTNNGISWKMNQWNPKSLQIKTNQSSPESEWRFYNTTAMPGKITKVVIKFSALALKNTSTTGFKFVGGSAAVTGTTGGTDGVWNASAKTLTWTPSASDNFTYFALYQNGKVATGTNNLATSDAIVVTYETSGDEETVPSLTEEQFSWSAVAATATLPDQFDEKPTLINTEDLAVTYSTSDDKVATIDASGNVTLVGVGTADIKATAGDGVTFEETTVAYTLTVKPAPLVIEPIEGGIIDILTHKTFAATSNQYTNFTNKQATNENHSDAVYAGKTARNGNATQYSIQLNTSDKGRIATTTSGGIAKRVYVKWSTQGTLNTNARELYIYGSNTAFTGSETTAPSTKIGAIKYTTGAAEAYVDLTGDYKHIFMTGSGAIYMDEIQVTWVAGETPEVPTIDAPTFSLEAGTYNEEQEVTLSAEEGTIYYTLDGTTPTADSEEYTEAIVLDECGEITIKAIAISGETTSSVASATYTIKLPLNNSQANPYTEAEAIEVYNGGCYDDQEVYVKGVVANAQFYSSNTYTITLEDGFLFYYFYEAAGDTQFTEDYIEIGDTLVACGKLDNYKEGTYQLAKGCYLVEYKAYSVPKVDISNTPETAYTVAEAIALIDNVTSDLTKQVYVKGEISEVESFNDNYGNITYWIQDEEGNKFECYGGLGLNQEQFTSIDDLVVGSQVVVYGTMKKYNSIYEFNHSNYIVSLTLPSYTVTVSANLAEAGTVTSGGSFEHGAEATLTATAAEGYEFVNWTSGETEVSTANPFTFTVTSDTTLVANFKEAEPEIESTWTVVGSVIFDAHWDQTAAANDMTLQSDGTYKWEKSDLELAANTSIEFKVVRDHDWGVAYPAQNYNLLIPEDGIYTVTIIFNPESEEVAAVATKTGDAEINVTISYVLMGVAGDWTTGITLTQNPENVNEYVLLGQPINEGDAVKVVTLTDGVATAWCGNVDQWSVEHEKDDMDNIILAPGKYDFYFKVLDNLIYIGKTVEPEVPTALDNIDSTVAPVKAIVNGQLIIIKNGVQYNAQGAVVK